jgi:hypothetical protein
VIVTFARGHLDRTNLAMVVEVTQESAVIDVAEDAGIHPACVRYQDLLGFIQDYQNKRAGWPTVATNIKIGNWDHELDLETTIQHQRTHRRRAFTIK